MHQTPYIQSLPSSVMRSVRYVLLAAKPSVFEAGIERILKGRGLEKLPSTVVLRRQFTFPPFAHGSKLLSVAYEDLEPKTRQSGDCLYLSFCHSHPRFPTA